MKSREVIGKGMEHTVYSSRDLRFVLKKPHSHTVQALRIFFDGPSTIKKEINEMQHLLENTPVEIPKTRILPINHGYIMIQERINNDNSVDPEKLLPNYPTLYTEYQSNSANFASSNGTLYYLDPTLGQFDRFVIKYHLMNADRYKRCTGVLKRVIRKAKRINNLRSS